LKIVRKVLELRTTAEQSQDQQQTKSQQLIHRGTVMPCLARLMSREAIQSRFATLGTTTVPSGRRTT
jgi:hypothetical protein